MCGPSRQQVQISDEQNAFYGELTKEYKTVFGESQGILSKLTSTFEPILAAGPNQEGFSPTEKAVLDTQANEGVGRNYANAAKALNSQIAAEGGGNAYLPSGGNAQLQGELATSAANTQSGEQLGILNADYAQGRQNFYNAAGALGGVANQYNPTGFANAATGAGSAASTTANEITQANNSWMGLVGGVLGGVASDFSFGFGK